MYESEAEVLARIEATRARMSDTIDQIGDRVNPDRVQAEMKARAREQVREVKDNMKYKARSAMRDIEHGVSDAGRGVWDTIRENPIPAGLVGVGLAWLVANGATRDWDRGHTGTYPPGTGLGYGAALGTTGAYDDLDYNREYGYGREYGYDVRDRSRKGVSPTGELYARPRTTSGAAEGSEGKMENVKERVSEAADEVRDRAEHVRDRAEHAVDATRDRASELAHRTSERMEEMQHRAEYRGRQMASRARRAERRVEDAVHDNPLAAGALAAALGFAAGLMIPETRRENQMFGPARDRVIDNAERTARRAGQKARDTARDVVSETARKTVDEVMPGAKDRERESVSEPWR
ncbi:MAG: DUF3618 domain-containing protein [Gemmatimonadetes bacterium]|nr:DUF3618 domain-containing protein [Gemmatimonadota bacterium]